MKGQIKIAETLAVLTIFFVMLMFGFTFYVDMQADYVEKEKERQAELRALQVAQKAAYMPEFQCSIQNIQDDNCFDSLKVKVFMNLTDDNESLLLHYYDILGNTQLVLEDIYPGGGECDPNCTIYDNLDNTSTGLKAHMTPVSIFNPKDRRYSIGILYIRVST